MAIQLPMYNTVLILAYSFPLKISDCTVAHKYLLVPVNQAKHVTLQNKHCQSIGALDLVNSSNFYGQR
jgi:hypothetical protein